MNLYSFNTRIIPTSGPPNLPSTHRESRSPPPTTLTPTPKKNHQTSKKKTNISKSCSTHTHTHTRPRCRRYGDLDPDVCVRASGAASLVYSVYTREYRWARVPLEFQGGSLSLSQRSRTTEDITVPPRGADPVFRTVPAREEKVLSLVARRLLTYIIPPPRLRKKRSSVLLS